MGGVTDPKIISTIQAKNIFAFSSPLVILDLTFIAELGECGMRFGIFSFFSGCGLLDLGFEFSNFDILRVNECYQPFLEAYKYSRAKIGLPSPVYGYDSESIDTFLNYRHKLNDLKSQIQEASADGLVGFIGGPPCPDFSVGGKNRGKDGENGRLTRSYIDLVRECSPDFFLFENVKGLWKTKRHREFYDGLKDSLTNHGFLLTERLINAIEYGAPQDRERIVLLGFTSRALEKAVVKPGSLDFPWDLGDLLDTKQTFALPWPTREPFEEDGFRDKPTGIVEELTVQYWFEENDVKTHPNRVHFFRPRQGIHRFKTVDEGDDLKKSFKRLHRWRYSPTACYGNNEVHLHPYKARRITVAEALALQSVPKQFELPSSMSLSDMFKTVGNGVPFLAAKGIASSLRKFLGAEPDAHHCTRPSSSNFAVAEASA
jgi:DNA (cytosine-5)-methyltransferase 1